MPSTFEENLDKVRLHPHEYVQQTARGKALEVPERPGSSGNRNGSGSASIALPAVCVSGRRETRGADGVRRIPETPPPHQDAALRSPPSARFRRGACDGNSPRLAGCPQVYERLVALGEAPPRLVIGADTVRLACFNRGGARMVMCDGCVLEKPPDD